MINIEHIKTPNPEDFVQKMLKFQGDYHRIGSGSYGEVFGAKKSNIVYKVGSIDSNFPYLTFVDEVIKQSKPNPFFPRIYGVRYIHASDCCDEYQDLFVVAMERLQRLTDKVWRDFESLVVYELDETPCDIPDELEARTKAIGFEVNPNQDLKQAMKLLKKIYNKYSRSGEIVFDLHRENFMCRQKGSHPIFVDPFA